MKLDEDQLDALAEVVNIGVGRAAASLHELVDRHVKLSVPSVSLCRVDEMSVSVGGDSASSDVSVVQGFTGEVSGKALLAFPERSGVTLAKLLGESPDDDEALESDVAGVLEEIGNIVLNGVLGSLANMFGDDFRYTVPELATGSVAEVIANETRDTITDENPTCLLADARFRVEETQVTGSLLLVFNSQKLTVLLDRLLESVSA